MSFSNFDSPGMIEFILFLGTILGVKKNLQYDLVIRFNV
jgi:hypothetical protein